MALFKKILQAPSATFTLTTEQKVLVAANFPIVFLTSDPKNKLSDFYEEYRTTKAMKLGKDITLVATDTIEHKQQIIHALQNHHIGPVQVVLFEELQQALLVRSICTANLKSMMKYANSTKNKELYFLYTTLDALNDQCNALHQSNPETAEQINEVLNHIELEMTCFEHPHPDLHLFCNNIEKHIAILSSDHREPIEQALKGIAVKAVLDRVVTTSVLNYQRFFKLSAPQSLADKETNSCRTSELGKRL